MSDVMAWNLATAHRPQPVLALAGAIALQAVLAGRKVEDARRNRTNLYIIAVASSAAGKDRARDANTDILYHSGAGALDGSGDLASDAGLISAVEAHPAIMFQIDEIGRLLRTTSDAKDPHRFNIVTALMRLYSTAAGVYRGKAYADSKRNVEIDQPCVCLHGMTVPEHLFKAMTAENLSDGMLARMLIFEVPGMGERQFAEYYPPPQAILDAAGWWFRFAPGGNLSAEHPKPERIAVTNEAKAIFDALAGKVDAALDTGDNVAQSVWARAEEKACRLALVYACSANRKCLRIDTAAATWACDLSEYLTRRMLWLASEWVSAGTFDERQKRIVRMIRDAGGEITKNALLHRTRSLSMRERTEALHNLVATGEIVERMDLAGSKGGRPKTTYALMRGV